MAQQPAANQYLQFVQNSKFRSAREALLSSAQAASQEIQTVRGPLSEESHRAMMERVEAFAKTRGRPMYYPFVASGLGNGPLMEMQDGSVKYDMITGIGVNLLGHSHPRLMSAFLEGMTCDTMQGNLQPGPEATELIEAMLKAAGPRARLKHAWPLLSGTMSNEMALKIIRQKKFPAYKVIAFKDCFCGRSTAMQELTDNPKYRVDQPLFNLVKHIPFYDEKLGLSASISQTTQAMQAIVDQEPGQYAALMMELVQGEGGFNVAPREYWIAVFQKARALNLAIWDDEIQTFGRTGELFAFQTFGVEEYIDVVTIGKCLQSCMVMYTEEYNPKPGLIAGTFAGSTASFKSALATLQIFAEGKMTGCNGIIVQNAKKLTDSLNRLSQTSCAKVMKPCRGIAGMVAFEPYDGSNDRVQDLIKRLFKNGVMAFSCGHGPYYIRMLPPLPVMNDRHIQEVTAIIEKTLLETPA